MDSTEYNRKLNKASTETCKILCDKYNVVLQGTGGGVRADMRYKALRFLSKNNYSIEEARKVIIDMVDVFVNELNKDPSLKEYKEFRYPFSEKNIDLGLLFNVIVNQKSTLKPGDLRMVSCNEGRLFYGIYESNNKTEIVLRETYEEAKAKLIIGN